MSLFDILACPTCKVSVTRRADSLVCPQCGTAFPIVNGVPVMFPDGSHPEIEHEAELNVYTEYNPWVHRIILQSLLDDQIVVDIGSGNMALDDPCIIRMDVKLSPHVDLVGDIHALPFLPQSLDYVFSLAVFEHLRNPFTAAQEVFDALKDGGYIYHECNFVFPYHGYPHHYFNATMQGMEQIFGQFTPLRKGVATYQMPSFTLDSVIRMYIANSRGSEYPHGRRLIALLNEVLQHDLMDHDIYFSEEGALRVAAGTYFSGYKQVTSESSLIPTPIQEAWKRDASLQARMANMNDLTAVDNVLRWAKGEGRVSDPEIERYLIQLKPFDKRGDEASWSREYVHGLPYEEARFGAIGYDSDNPLEVRAQIAEQRYQKKRSSLAERISGFLRSEDKPAALRHFWQRTFTR